MDVHAITGFIIDRIVLFRRLFEAIIGFSWRALRQSKCLEKIRDNSIGKLIKFASLLYFIPKLKEEEDFDLLLPPLKNVYNDCCNVSETTSRK